MKQVHTISLLAESNQAMLDRIVAGFIVDVVNPAGDGAVASIGAGTAGAGYATIPTVAFATVGSGTSATATAVMGVVSATVAAAGSGYTNGAQTLTGTTGTGTKFQAAVTVAGGVVTAVTSISVAGAYTVMPTLAGEATTGGGGTGATLNIVMGVASYTVGAGGTLYRNGTTATLTGGTPTTAAVPGAVVITTANDASATIVVAIAAGQLPAKYAVSVTPNQACTAAITSKTAKGFNVVLTPRSGAALAAGTFDLVIRA